MVDRASPSQDAVMEFVTEYKTDEAGYYDSDANSPTYEEIANHLSISTATAYTLVLRLVKRGKLRITKKGKIALGGTYTPPE